LDFQAKAPVGNRPGLYGSRVKQGLANRFGGYGCKMAVDAVPVAFPERRGRGPGRGKASPESFGCGESAETFFAVWFIDAAGCAGFSRRLPGGGCKDPRRKCRTVKGSRVEIFSRKKYYPSLDRTASLCGGFPTPLLLDTYLRGFFVGIVLTYGAFGL